MCASSGSFLSKAQLCGAFMGIHSFDSGHGILMVFVHSFAWDINKIGVYFLLNTMRRSVRRKYQDRGEKKAISEDQKDDKYYERRKRNNEAAKKSRDARRLREDLIGLRVKILENENEILQRKIILLCEEIESLYTFIIEIQQKIPGIFTYNNWPDRNVLQTPFHHSQLCCIRNFNGMIAPHLTVADSNLNTTAIDIATLTNLISRLSSILQTSIQSTI